MTLPQEPVGVAAGDPFGGQHMAREILRVERHDGIGAAGDGAGQHVAVVGVGQDQAILDLGVRTL